MSDWCHIYIIAHSRAANPRSPVKVGISGNAAGRLRSLQTANPNRLTLLCVFNVPTREIALELEGAFHRVLSKRRLTGEWFDMPPLAAVQMMCVNLREYFHHFLSDDRETYEAAVEMSGLLDVERRLANASKGQSGNDNLVSGSQ